MNQLHVPVELPNDVVPLVLNGGAVLALAIAKGSRRPIGKRCDHGNDRGVAWELFFDTTTNQYNVVWDCPSKCFKVFTLKQVVRILSQWIGIDFTLGEIKGLV